MRWPAGSMFQDGMSCLPLRWFKGAWGCTLSQDVQSRQDEEIDALAADAFQDSEALEAQREHWNLKYMCVLVPCCHQHAPPCPRSSLTL